MVILTKTRLEFIWVSLTFFNPVQTLLDLLAHLRKEGIIL